MALEAAEGKAEGEVRAMSEQKPCDRCGRPVPRTNDAMLLESVATGDLAPIMRPTSRHLIPVGADNLTLICPGSPSRAQYLPGFPRDPRGLAPYDQRKEAAYRMAFFKIRFGD